MKNWFVVVLLLGALACGDDDGMAAHDAGPDAADNDSGAAPDAGRMDAGGMQDAATDSGATCGMLGARTPTCGACIEANCCVEAAACSADANCTGLVACLRTCDADDASTDCRNQCGAMYAANGAPTGFNPLLLCIAEADNCGTQCPFSSP